VYSYESGIPALEYLMLLVCDYLGANICEDICWDIDNIFAPNEVYQFNLNDVSLRAGISIFKGKLGNI
jgi:hypothetical protein